MDKNKLKKLIKEVLSNPTKKDSCNCGCDSCESVGNEGVVLNESLIAKSTLSPNLQYHVDNKLPLVENTFRYGSTAFLNLWSEARKLYSRNMIHVNDADKAILAETNLGEYGIYEGQKVPLDMPMLEENKEWPKELLSRYRDMKFILQNSSPNKATYQIIDLENNNKVIGTLAFNSIYSLEDFADNYIKPQGGTQSTYLGEDKKNKTWSSYEQKMVNQILRAKKDGTPIFELPMKTQDFYRKHKDEFTKPLNEAEFKGREYTQQDLYAQELFGIELFSWLDFWEQFHIVQKYKLDRSIITKEGIEKNKNINEAEFKGKNVDLNKPKRGGSKKFYVYVRDPQTKKIKKVSFGDSGGLSTKVNDPKARKAFASRHNCEDKKDRTTPGFWSCNIGKYWKSLGGDKNFNGYW